MAATLEKIRQAGVTLNKEKCEFSRTQVKFLGQIIDGKGVRPDPDKIKAITDMEEPCTVTEVRRFLGIVNQFGKFSPKIAEMSHPLRELLSK